MRKILFSFVLSTCVIALAAQQPECVIKGAVTDSTGTPLQLVNIGLSHLTSGAFSDALGQFTLTIVADSLDHILEVSSIGYKTTSIPFIAVNDTLAFNIVLSEHITSLRDVIVRENFKQEEPTMHRIPIKDILSVPATGGTIETLIKTLPGVYSGNELSNQYSVRGGSYDENLVYLNDIEIYRPTLIHSGKQEGLSIINPDMVGSIEFSLGGFNASYGDKMASVLDIKYREPNHFKGSVSAGLLTNSAHIEGLALNNRISFTTGIRYKTNRFLLGTLDTKANYKPQYYDLQTQVNYRVSGSINISLLATRNISRYTFIPQSQKSSFGNILEAYQLYVDYEGSERDSYRNNNTAITLKVAPETGPVSKFIFHSYTAQESETYDIRGSYALNMLDKDLGSENLGDSLMNIGTGSWLDHARNYLDASIFMIGYKSRWEHSDNVISWGTKIKFERIEDRLREWRRIDSTGYTLPYSTLNLILTEFAASSNQLSTRRIESYIIDNYTITPGGHSLVFTGGVRLSYWSFNSELLVSPRFSVSWQPPVANLKIHASYGVYYQPPFYREMRNPDGDLNTGVRSQKSVHYVTGYIYDFNIGDTPLRFTGEIYYKEFTSLIPYKFDNVRVVYSAYNKATGRAKGIDIRLNGEFVKDAESWVSFSLMDVKHDIVDDDLPGYPAPADVRFSTNVYFQDYFPSNPSIRAHINIQYSTGVPVSSPFNDRYDSYHRMPPYRRVDIGFSKIFIRSEGYPLSVLPSWIESIITGIEIFNLIDINNTISYNWLTTVNNLNGETRQFAVPNYLTGRSLNLRLTVTF